MASDGWRIDQECPQCGGPVTLDETDRVLACPYCRVRLYIAADGLFRYVLPARSQDVDGRLLIPYWRVKGQVFSCVPFEVMAGVIDMTRRAVDFPGLPSSLGVRPQAMKLRFATTETNRAFVRAQTSPAEAVANCERLYNDLNDLVVFDQAFIGETVSLVYLPITTKGAIYDAVVDRKIAPLPAEGIDRSALIDRSAAVDIRFVPTLCPHCGWDLEAERDSLVLLCQHCQSAWQAKGLGLQRTAFGVLGGDFKPDRYLPFWRTKPLIEGVTLRSYADLVRFANLPKILRDAWEKQELILWTPAFKVHPRNLLGIAKTLTIAQPSEEIAEHLPKAAYHPVNLPPAESVECIKVLLADFARPKQAFFPRLGDVSVGVAERKLVFVPFQEIGGEIRHPDHRICISRNLLEYGRNL